MSYEPRFSITPALLANVERVAALRERILGAAVEVSWIPALQKDTRTDLWTALDVSKQGAMDLLRPLLAAGLVEKVGTKKSGRYALKHS